MVKNAVIEVLAGGGLLKSKKSVAIARKISPHL
jgi:hypothetical protein